MTRNDLALATQSVIAAIGPVGQWEEDEARIALDVSQILYDLIFKKISMNGAARRMGKLSKEATALDAQCAGETA